MFNVLVKGYLAAMAVKLFDNYRHLSIRFFQIEAAKSYLHGVRLARLSALGLLGLMFIIGLILIGVVLLHAGLFLLLPWSLKAKAIVGLVLGIVYIIAGVIALVMAMAEKRWLQKSGATEMIEAVIRGQ